MGEGMLTDQHIMPYITSANIACGGHAGDDDSMRRTIDFCIAHNVCIGAHPSYADRNNFGRIDLLGKSIQLKDIPQLIGEQAARLKELCKECGAVMHHIKPHGALYNRAAKDQELSAAICEGLSDVDTTLKLYGLSGSQTFLAASEYSIEFVHEVFADRSYQPDGSLTPRTEPKALIEDEQQSLTQVLQMVKSNTVTALSGQTVRLRADSICIHGDSPGAVRFARIIRNQLRNEGIKLQSPRLK